MKSGFVTLIGRPNVGKSTLMNALIGERIAITSNKAQTTRHRIETVYTDERGQIIFLDTPGIHKAKNRLGDYMVGVATESISEVDLVLWLIEPSDRFGEGEDLVRAFLKAGHKPVVLVINKTDTADKATIAACREAFAREYDFADVIEVSALKGENVGRLLQLLYDRLPEGPLFYDEDTLTDQSMRMLAAEFIREKALRYLSDEVPHGIAVEIEAYHELRDGAADIEAAIICEKESHKGIVIGKGGATIKKIGTEARQEIEKLAGGKINLKLFVKVRKDWRNDPAFLKSIGYSKRS
ncbi:MAG: GTPase Era [Lachnospiraceae bacterium]|nr:GTPase Era [Lachnospiraceae bacterium]